MANRDALDAVKARIRALKERTVARGCTEAEALAAAAKVVELMRAHGLDDDVAACSTEDAGLGRARRAPTDELIPVVAWVCHCTSWLRKDAARGPFTATFLGRDPWPEVAAWLYGVVAGAADRALRDFLRSPDYRRRRVPATRATARRHFAEGFVAALRHKLTRMKVDACDGAQQRRDLALAEKARAGTGFAFRDAAALGRAKGGARFADARRSGIAAGRATDLGWGVGGPTRTAALPALCRDGEAA